MVSSLKSKRKINKSNSVKIDPDIMIIERYNKKQMSPHVKMIDSKKAKDFLKMNKNRYCNRKDFTECIDPKIKLVGDPVIIGNGTFGILLKLNTTSKESVGIKFIFNINKEESKKQFIDMEKELAFSYYMGHEKIGPPVIDSFYYNFDYDEFSKYPILYKIVQIINKHFLDKGEIYPQFIPLQESIMKGKDINNYPIEIQCIVMKAYDSDCQHALLNTNINIDTKCKIIVKMIHLIQEQIRIGLYCYDVKAGNFVVSISDKHVDVKMIDFGSDFCTEKRIYSMFENNDIVPILGIKFIELLYISNVIQLYILFVRTNFMDTLSLKDSKKILNSFFDHRIFKLFFSKDWQKFIVWYLDYATYIKKKNMSDPSNNLVWYSNLNNNIEELYTDKNIENIKMFLIYNLQKAINTLNK